MDRPTAVLDTLTGAMGFEWFKNELAREYARSRRHQHPLALIKCDVDKMNLINNGFGRDAGDEVLRELYARVKRVIRASDLMARGRDDEFIIMLVETDLAGAALVAQRVGKVMTSRPVTCSAGVFPVTVSSGYSAVGGVSELARLGCTDLLDSTEKQLRSAMRTARNSISGAPAQLSEPTPNAARVATGAYTQVPAPEELTLMEYDGTPARDCQDFGCRYG